MREMASSDFGVTVGAYLAADYRDKYAAFLSASCKTLEGMKITVPDTAAMRFLPWRRAGSVLPSASA